MTICRRILICVFIVYKSVIIEPFICMAIRFVWSSDHSILHVQSQSIILCVLDRISQSLIISLEKQHAVTLWQKLPRYLQTHLVLSISIPYLDGYRQHISSISTISIWLFVIFTLFLPLFLKFMRFCLCIHCNHCNKSTIAIYKRISIASIAMIAYIAFIPII